MAEVQLPAGYMDTPAERAKLTSALSRRGVAGLQVESIATDPTTGAKTAALAADPNPRPGAQAWSIDPKISASQGAQVAAHADKMGLTLIEWRPAAHTAVVAAIPPATRQLRDRVAPMLKCDPWELEILPRWTVDADAGTGRIDAVTVLRAPAFQTADKRIAAWTEAILLLPGGSDGWRVEDDPQNDRVTLRWGAPERLLDVVPLPDILPDSYPSEDWSTLPLGVGTDGELVGPDLTSGPHTLVVGPTGTGKSTTARTLVSSAIARGFEIAVVDPTKGAGDFLKLRRWFSAMATTLHDAVDLLEFVYRERDRRMRVQLDHEVGSWYELPAEVLRAENIRPWLIFVDEYTSLVAPYRVGPNLPRDHPRRVAADDANMAKEIITDTVGRLAREARFVGIHLVVVTQRPDTRYVDGELRSNLTSAVALASPGIIPAPDTLRMVFENDGVAPAIEMFRALDDGKHRGLAGMKAEGGTIAGFRVAFARATEVPEVLDAIGVPDAVRWDIAAPAPADDAPPWVTEPEPQIIESAVSFSLDDLESSYDDDSEAQSVEPAAPQKDPVSDPGDAWV